MTRADQQAALAGFRKASENRLAGQPPAILLTTSILERGFDDPAVDAVIFLCYPMHLVTLIQMMGGSQKTKELTNSKRWQECICSKSVSAFASQKIHAMHPETVPPQGEACVGTLKRSARS